MARRDQPYIPLYADDFQTDEKLIMCSAESTGVFIRIMCLMHKSDPYGKILLKQKFKQNSKQTENFASQLAIYFPYDAATIARSLSELVAEDVLQIEGDFLIQKRMVRDAEISEIRGKVGRDGGKKSAEKRTNTNTHFASEFAQANFQANTVIENEIVIEDESKGIGGMGEKGLVKRETALAKSEPRTPESINAYFAELGAPQEAEKFIDYYSSNGWKVGRNAMKDWKATARNWVRRANPQGADRKLNRHSTMGEVAQSAEEMKEYFNQRNTQNQ